MLSPQHQIFKLSFKILLGTRTLVLKLPELPDYFKTSGRSKNDRMGTEKPFILRINKINLSIFGQTG